MSGACLYLKSWSRPLVCGGPIGDVADALSGNGSELDDNMIPKDAFISPDEPMVHDPFRDALISPDEPLKPREEEGGIVVGMDGSTEHEGAKSAGVPLGLDQVAAALEALSAELKENGIISLRIGPGLSAFERNLKNHLAEYLSNYD